MKILKITNNLITPDKVKDGELCIIRVHKPSPDNVGDILQRYINTFITIGKPAGQSYTGLYKNNNGDVLVEVLQAGTQIEL